LAEVDDGTHKSEGRVHFSDLANARSSSAHYKYSVSTKKEVRRAMTVGALTDAMVLGGRKWIEYEGKSHGKEWQALHPRICRDNRDTI